MFDGHNPLKHVEFETDGAVATWPAGSDEFNRDYTMRALGDEVMQMYCDGGWVTSNEGYESGGGMLGMGGQQVEQEGNNMIFFDGHEDLEPEYMMFTGPELYNSDLTDLSGQDIDRNGVEDGEVVVVRETDDGYRLETAEDPEAMEQCVAFGYAEAFDDGFPVITVENARDAFMALGYDESFQDELADRHSSVSSRIRQEESEVREKYIDDDNWEKPDHKDSVDERRFYGLHQKLAEAYADAEGEHHEDWDPEKDFNSFYTRHIEEMAERQDEVAELAENILELQAAKKEAREEERKEAREELLPEFFKDAWYENVVSQSAEMRDVAEEHGEDFLAVHDVHDAFHYDMQSMRFDNPDLSDSRKLSVLVEAAEEEFDEVEVYGIPWNSEEDGKEQSMEMRDDFKDVFPTYEDLIPEEDLPFARGTGITRGTPFRPVMTLSDEPVEVEGEEVVDLSDLI